MEWFLYDYGLRHEKVCQFLPKFTDADLHNFTYGNTISVYSMNLNELIKNIEGKSERAIEWLINICLIVNERRSQFTRLGKGKLFKIDLSQNWRNKLLYPQKKLGYGNWQSFKFRFAHLQYQQEARQLD